MTQFNPIRQLPTTSGNFTSNDVLVVFGEVFDRGYVNGLVDEARAKGMQVIYATVGRRDENNDLRSLTDDEIAEKSQSPLINIPLEAGFDLEPFDDGSTVCDMLKGIKLKEWEETQLDWDKIKMARQQGHDRFEACVDQFVAELDELIGEGKNVIFGHTMAGGVPRAKIVLPLLNRVFKGHGDRFLSSEKFWNSDIGKLTAMGFEDVSATTLDVLIKRTAQLRADIEDSGQSVSYVAFGYHGTELYIDDNYKWQSYAPYLTNKSCSWRNTRELHESRA
ncbi:MAG: hypothetical protein R2827_02870 [Bdellovibrionales bacterium]